MSHFEKKLSLQRAAKMTDEINGAFKIDQNIKDAICAIQREVFVPSVFKMHAYKIDALPLGANQWISSPLTVAKMTQALSVQGCDSVLEVGCGSGYQAAVLSRLFRRVFTIERIEKLLIEAKERFKRLEIMNIHTKFDDGQNGWSDFAPYDRILFSACAKEIPQKLFEQLRVDGILVAPIEKNGKQIITRFIKTKSGIKKEEFDSCLFVPVLNGVAR